MKKKLNWRNVIKERNRKIWAYRIKGLSYAEIGRKMKMSRQLIKYICRDVDK